MQTKPLPKPTIYNDSRINPKQSGAIRELLMSVYPLALVGVLLLMISILGLANTFPSSVVNGRPQVRGGNQPLSSGYMNSQEESLVSE